MHSMRNLLLLLLGVAGLASLQMIMSETLVPEDGTITAATLPLDKDTSTSEFESATFGMG